MEPSFFAIHPHCFGTISRQHHFAQSAYTRCPASSKSVRIAKKQEEWISLDCVNVYDGKKYKMLNCNEVRGNIEYNVVFPSQFAHLVIQYQKHPEAKSLAPDGSICKAETKGVLKRAHVIAEEIRYVGKETDRKWEEGDEISLLDFSATEYGRKGKVIASEEVKAAIQRIGINRCARESGFHRANVVRKLVRGLPIKRVSYTEFVGWLTRYGSTLAAH